MYHAVIPTVSIRRIKLRQREFPLQKLGVLDVLDCLDHLGPYTKSVVVQHDAVLDFYIFSKQDLLVKQDVATMWDREANKLTLLV